MMDMIRAVLLVLLVPAAVLAGSHSLTALLTYIEGQTPFPEFSFTLMLDDITVGYYDSELKALVPRSLDKEQKDDAVATPDYVETIISFVRAELTGRYQYLKYRFNYTNSIEVQQSLVICELLDNDQPGQLITKNAVRGISQDELRFYKGNLTYQSSLNITEETLKKDSPLIQIHHETLYYPGCIKILRGYLKMRYYQVKRKVKPRVRLLQRRRSVSGWDGITCLATGFYPRHINLTILRDGQPVPDHLTTGGDLLPNGDRTYQMRRNLELREEELKEKHNFTCTVTHLGLDNKLDIHLDLGPGVPITSIISSVVVALVLVSVMVVVIWMLCRRKRGASSQGKYSSTCSSHSLVTSLIYIEGPTPFPEFSFTFMLDDITVGYFDSELKTLIPRGLDKEQEDDGAVTPEDVKTVTSYLHADFKDRHHYLKYKLNYTDSVEVQQRLVVCELLDDDQPGPLILKNAVRGITRDELQYHEHKFTYKNDLNLTDEILKPRMEIAMWRHENLYYPVCIKTLRGYLKKRRSQVKRKVKPRVRLLQRRRSVSGWDGITCLATGFYPRHVNLTILRDGQPVPDHLTTGGDLLPNGDGTYQMRRNLELREEELKEKQNFTCTVTHLSLDNKLIVYLDFDPGEPITSILSSLVVAALVLLSVMVVFIWMIYRRKREVLPQIHYLPAAAAEASGAG